MRQLAALIWLRSRLWWHALRSRATLADNAVAVILAMVATVLSAALSFALAGITHIGLMDGGKESVHVTLIIVLWVLGFMAVVMPLFFGAGQPQVPLRRLLVFPLSRLRLYQLSLAASFASGTNLFWYPILASVTVVAVVVDDQPAFDWLTTVALFGACLVIWCHTALMIIQWILRRRSARELAMLIGLLLLVSVSMLPAVIQEQAEERGGEWFDEMVPGSVLSVVDRAASLFPPSIAGRTLEKAYFEGSGSGSESFLWLALWAAAGVAIGYGIVRRYLLEGDQATRAHSAATDPGTEHVRWWSAEQLTVIPTEVRAVAAKELRYLLRSTTGKFNIVIMPIFVVAMALIVARDFSSSFLGVESSSLVFLGLMIYASMFANNFLLNAYAWEGAGAQTYFLCPVDPVKIVLGKNLAVWIYDIVLGAEGVIAFCLISGVPPAPALIGGCLAFVAAVVAATVVGNFLSPTMPVPRDISSITNSPSQTAVLANFGVLIACVLVIGGSMTIPALFGAIWLGPVLLALLILAEIVVYSLILPRFGELFYSRREAIVEALQA
jgi:hypothetical protein